VILEHSNDPVSAKWNNTTNTWHIGENKKYRWCNTDNEPKSDWFYDMTDALNWIIEYDQNKHLSI
jgi:hypothetical protein